MKIPEELQKTMERYNWHGHAYTERDLNQYTDIIKKEYGDYADIAQNDYVTWQCKLNPAGNVNMWIAEADNRLVGAYSAIPVKMKSDDKELFGSISVNTLTDEAYRGKKIFTTLAELSYIYGYTEKNIKLIYGFPNKNSLHGFTKYLKFIIVAQIPLLIKINNFGNIVKSKLQWLPQSVFNSLGKLFFHRTKSLFIKDIDIRYIDHFDDKFDVLYQNNKHLFHTMVIRDKDYLNWRYVENPVRKYKIVVAEDINEQVKGFIVFRITEIDKIRVGLIGDLFVEANNLQITSLLIQTAEEYFDREKADMYGALMFNHIPYYDAFKTNGFIKCPKKFEPQPFPIIVRSMDPHLQEVYKKENWYLTMSDYDIF